MSSVTNESVRVVTCTSDAPWEPPLVHGLQRHELGIHLVRRCVDHGELLGVALRDRPRAAIVAADLPWLDRELVGTLQEHGVAVIVIDGRGTRPLDRIGVTHRLSASATADDVAALLHRLEAGASPTPAVVRTSGGTASGRLIAVWGGAGSPGRTTVAVHAATELGAAGRDVLLVDADVWAASVAQVLELAEAPSIAQASRLAGDGWSEPLAACVQSGPDGIGVLAGLARAELWPEVREHAWRAVLDAARAEHDLVVVDVAAPIEEDEELSFDRVPYRRNLVTRIVLEEADSVLVVAAADPVGLRRGIVAHRTLVESLPSTTARAAFVLNRVPDAARRAQEASAAIGEWTGKPPAALLPVEPAFDRVVWEGRPLAAVRRRSRWLRELRATVVAAAVAGEPT